MRRHSRGQPHRPRRPEPIPGGRGRIYRRGLRTHVESGVGANHVILGHSERRHLFGEDDALIARKMKAAVDHELVPILCVGETQEQRQADETVAVVTSQLSGGLAEVKGADVPEPRCRLRARLGDRHRLDRHTGPGAASARSHPRFSRRPAWGRSARQQRLRIQYGGSVKPGNAAELLAEPDIDGALVGGASLDPDSLAAIVEAVAT